MHAIDRRSFHRSWPKALIAVTCGLIWLLGVGPGRAGLPQRGPVPEFEVPAVQGMAEMDGRLDDACWRDALVSRAFYPGGTVTRAEDPASGTTLYLARSGRSLLVGMDCGPVTGKPGRESVSVFLDPLHSHEFTYGFTVWSDGEKRQDTWADPHWAEGKDHWEAAAARSDSGWSTELRIDLMHLPYLRAHADTAGLFVSRKLGDGSRLVWALNDTRRGLMESEEGWESFWACHVRGLDIPGMIAEMDEENAAFCAPLMPRVAALRQKAGRLLRDASLPPGARVKALSLAIWAEELDPKRRLYVERALLRGLEEREEFLRDAETLAAILVDGEEPEESAPPLARLAADAEGPALWEVDVARPISRFQGRSAGLSIGFAGMPLTYINEAQAPSAEETRRRCEEREKDRRDEGFEVWREQRGGLDICYQRRPGGTAHVSHAARGLRLYYFVSCVPGGEQIAAEALIGGGAVDQSVAEALLAGWQAPVEVAEVAGALGFPLQEAVLVVPAGIEASGKQGLARLQSVLGGLELAVGSLPETGPAVVLGTTGNEEVLREAGFALEGWVDGSSLGRAVVRNGGSRPLLALWGRDEAALERAARVVRDLRELFADRELLVGDLHAHSVLSDGSGSPRQVLLAAMAAGLGFAAITDHSMAEGSLDASRWCDLLGLDFTAIRGGEVLGAGFEVLALGIGEWVTPQADVEQVADEIHDQGGLALLCHVGYPDEETGARLMAEFDSFGLDGIDRWSGLMAGHLSARELVGRRPVVTSVTDTHELIFGHPQRTLVFAQDRSEQGILRAVKDGYYVTLSPDGIMGAPRLVDVTLALLSERGFLAECYRQRLEGRLGTLVEAWRAGGF